MLTSLSSGTTRTPAPAGRGPDLPVAAVVDLAAQRVRRRPPGDLPSPGPLPAARELHITTELLRALGGSFPELRRRR